MQFMCFVLVATQLNVLELSFFTWLKTGGRSCTSVIHQEIHFSSILIFISDYGLFSADKFIFKSTRQV